MATQGEVGAHLDLSDRHVRDLMAREIIPKGTPSNHDLDACRVAYIQHLRKVAAGHKGEGKLDLTDERARLAFEQANKTEMENAEKRGELISAPDYLAGAAVIVAGIRLRFMSMGAKLQHKLAGESDPRGCKRICDEATREILEDLSQIEVVTAPDGSASGTG